ncbi:MAG: radical SAM protein [Candidatus Omnitrophota bacterium]
MIEKKSYQCFTKTLHKKIKGLYPLSAQIELTYRCNLKCVHCYCKGSERKNELSTSEWKNIIDQIHSAGAIWLTITGGEPLVRRDFFDIYTYAKKKGFLISVFTNGILLGNKALECFEKYPPYSVEITLNGITRKTYESITQVKGSFKKLMRNIQKSVLQRIPLILKAVGLKQNKREIRDIKAFTEDLLGKKKFKFDSFVTPRLNGGSAPCLHRLSAEEIEEIENSDPDMRAQREKEFKEHKPYLREPEYKYHCNAWFNQFYITPYGRLRFCHLTDKYSTDLKKVPFTEGFYGKFPAILEEKHKSNSKCIRCDLRESCYHCPARAYLETGNEEAPVPYFCSLARMKKTKKEKQRVLVTQ